MPAKKPFTDLMIRGLKPKGRPYRVREGLADKGFGVQVSTGGTKTFFLAYVFDGKERFLKLGRYPECSLSEARQRCRDARNELERGLDPQAERERRAAERKRAEEERKARERLEAMRGTVAQLFEAYIGYLENEKSPRTAAQVRQAYEKDVLAVLDPDMKARDVTPDDIQLILNGITQRGADIQANRVRSYLMAAFNHGIKYNRNAKNLKANVLFGLKENPVRDIPPIVKQEKAGERDLSRTELATFWRSLDEYQGMDYLTKTAFRLALATGGQRIKEVIEAPWSEFDFDRRLWEMPPSRTKNDHPHIVPLNDLALSILNELRALTGDSRYLFPKRGDDNAPMPLASMSKALARYCGKTGFEKFTPRDLRRTCKSRMGELGLSKAIRDRLHNHALQDVSEKHYDRYDYLAEKTAAMTAWGEYLEAVIAGAEIVPIRTKK